MKNPQILHYAGTSEEDEAHLRLLLRSARKHLEGEWVLGEESDAAVVMTDEAFDPATGQAASGIRVQIVGADDPAPATRFLRRPLHAEAFAALLNEVARDRSGQQSQAAAAQAAASPDAPAPATSSAASPGDQPAPAPSPSGTAAASPPDKAAESTGEENLVRPLLYYLPKRVLGGPARIARDGAPPLVIDPESRMFWAEGSLPALEPYVREPLRFGDWERLSAEELEAVRKALPARPSACLTWMDVYLQSKGVLSRRFDPEGTYKLTRRLELANDYPRALRISAAMTQPRRLDAIARASGAEIAEVHDVVNAYEAIGYLEWTRPGAAPARRT